MNDTSERYSKMEYRRAGKSGLVLSALTLGFWHNFGSSASYSQMKDMVFYAFESGINSFDLANNYGPPRGEAERNFGKILKDDLSSYRDEIIISTKAGYEMWPGPCGKGGGRKHLFSSLDQSLKRMGLDYVDIYYHHCPDPDTPLEETVDALSSLVRSGKCLYVALSKYNASDIRKAYELFRSYKVHPVLDQVRFSLLDRTSNNDGLFDVLDELGLSSAIFSPLAQGLLTDKYIGASFPVVSRLKQDEIEPETIKKLKKLDEIASSRGQSLSEMALSYVLSQKSVATVVIGVRNLEQLKGNIRALDNCKGFGEEEEEEILKYL